MSYRKTLVIAAVSLASITPAVALAGPQHTDCILSAHQITRVAPYKTEVRFGHQTFSEVRGAVVHVQAAPGLTAEWLRLEVGRHLAAMQTNAMADCALDVKGVTVQVDSAGAGFDVKLIARDSKQAEEVLRRARLLG